MGERLFCLQCLVLVVLFSSGCGNSATGVSPESSASQSQSIRDANRELVQQALAKLKEGQIIAVDEEVESQCGGTPSHYRIKRENNELHLELNVQFKPDPDLVAAGRAAGFVERIRACTPAIQDYWRRYGIYFDLNVLTTNESNKAVDAVFVLHDGKPKGSRVEERTNSHQFFHDDFDCDAALHEFGHHLGLADEYSEEGTCRTPEFESHDEKPSSIMKSCMMYDSEFFPRHLKTILGPVFDPVLPKFYRLTVLEDQQSDVDHFGGFQFLFPSFSKLNSSGPVWAAPQGTCVLTTTPGNNGDNLRAGMQFQLALGKRFRSRSGSLAHPIWYQPGLEWGQTGVTRLECNIDSMDPSTYLSILSPYLVIEPVAPASPSD